MKKIQSMMLLMAVVLLCSCSKKAEENAVPQPTKLADYLWEMTIDDYCDTIPNFLIDHLGTDFNCSAVRNGNYYGRNLDFFVSEIAEIVVHVPAKDGRHASLGVARKDQFTDADIEKGLTAEDVAILPWGTFDGINDAGLFCNMNVTSWEDGGDNPGTNPGKPVLYNVFLVRALLDNCATVDEAIEYVNNHNVIGKEFGGFNLHFMIGDPNKTVVLEFIDNKAVFLEDQCIMTNFPIARPGVTPHADGLERYDILKEHYAEGGESMEGMRNLLKRVQYSQTYDPETKPFWCTEYTDANGNGYKPGTSLDILLADSGVKSQVDHFKAFKETGKYEPEWKLWWTTHNSTYDIKERKLWLTIREQYEKYYEFGLEQKK